LFPFRLTHFNFFILTIWPLIRFLFKSATRLVCCLFRRGKWKMRKGWGEKVERESGGERRQDTMCHQSFVISNCHICEDVGVWVCWKEDMIKWPLRHCQRYKCKYTDTHTHTDKWDSDEQQMLSCKCLHFFSSMGLFSAPFSTPPHIDAYQSYANKRFKSAPSNCHRLEKNGRGDGGYIFTPQTICAKSTSVNWLVNCPAWPTI